MENPPITSLNELDVTKTDVTIKVRILKLWKLLSFKVKNAIHAVELILMDEEGTKIQASVGGNYLVKYGRFLVEKSCVMVTKFDVGDNVSPYRPTNHKHKLFFNFSTDIRSIDDFGGSIDGFSFTSFDVLRNRRIPQDSPVDIIGYVDGWFPMVDHTSSNGRVNKKMSLQLRDLEFLNVYLTLWGEYAVQMSKFLEQKPGDVFVILQFGRYSFHEGKAYVSSSFQNSNLYLNEGIDELIDFQKRLLERRPDVGSSSRPFGSSQTGRTVHEDFLVGTAFKTIDELNKIQETMNVIVLGTVISFPPGVEWYYNSCKDCMKKVSVLYFVNDGEDGLDLSDEKQTVRCINDVCNEKGVSVVPRLKLQLKLQDSTGIASLTCLDHVARKLLGKTAEELVDKFLDGETDKLLPDEISNLVGKKMAFKVEISHFNVNNHYKSFTVKRFSGDPEIISQLESKIGIDHVALSNSMNLSSGDFASVDTVDLKDDSPMSMIGSSAGSISLVTKNAEKISQHSELKRNLGESLDHEESATKVALGCNEELNTYNKDKRKTRKYSANQKDSIPFNNAFETPVSLIDSSAGGMALRNKRTGKMKAQPELKRVLAEDFDRDESGSKDPLSLNEGSKSLLIPKKEK
ncbi:putative nucleic acid-binding, replication factor A [Helianthus annuus]|nr:putative nucleic acid-binding, replication factor A [Helianthus annuus]